LPATDVATGAVRSYRTFSPLPLASAFRPHSGRYLFCATILRVAPTGRYPAHCPAEFGLSSLRLRPCGLRRDGDHLALCDLLLSHLPAARAM